MSLWGNSGQVSFTCQCPGEEEEEGDHHHPKKWN